MTAAVAEDPRGLAAGAGPDPRARSAHQRTPLPGGGYQMPPQRTERLVEGRHHAWLIAVAAAHAVAEAGGGDVMTCLAGGHQRGTGQLEAAAGPLPSLAPLARAGATQAGYATCSCGGVPMAGAPP